MGAAAAAASRSLSSALPQLQQLVVPLLLSKQPFYDRLLAAALCYLGNSLEEEVIGHTSIRSSAPTTFLWTKNEKQVVVLLTEETDDILLSCLFLMYYHPVDHHGRVSLH